MEILKATRQAMEQALSLGADEVKIALNRSRGVDLEWRDGRIEQVQERRHRGLSAEIFVNGRYSVNSTSDLRPEALTKFLNDTISMTRLLEPDLHRRLPDPERYQGRAELDLDLEDRSFGEIQAQERLEQVMALEALVRQEELPIISVSTGRSDSFSESARVHSNGFEGHRRSSNFSLSAMVTVQDQGERRPMGWDYGLRRHMEELPSAERIAQKATQSAAAQLGARSLKTGRYPVLVENRALGRLLGALLQPLSGPLLQQKRSLWEGKLGEQICSPLLSLKDSPHRPRGLGAALWDGDGFATQPRYIIQEGRLMTYLIDDYYARKMGVEPTGANTHDLEWAYGDQDLKGLIADVKEGLLLERFLGGNSNETTGEISMGCAGRVIRDGQIAEPVSEVNLSGHFGEIWQRLVAVGDDPDENSSARCPSCLFEDVQLSGS